MAVGDRVTAADKRAGPVAISWVWRSPNQTQAPRGCAVLVLRSSGPACPGLINGSGVLLFLPVLLEGLALPMTLSCLHPSFLTGQQPVLIAPGAPRGADRLESGHAVSPKPSQGWVSLVPARGQVLGPRLHLWGSPGGVFLRGPSPRGGPSSSLISGRWSTWGWDMWPCPLPCLAGAPAVPGSCGLTGM